VFPSALIVFFTPPSFSMISSHSGAVEVSHHNFAGRITSPLGIKRNEAMLLAANANRLHFRGNRLEPAATRAEFRSPPPRATYAGVAPSHRAA